MIHAASYGEATSLMKRIEQTQKAKGKLERIQSLHPDELYISALMMCANLVNPNWKDQLESEIRRQEQSGEAYALFVRNCTQEDKVYASPLYSCLLISDYQIGAHH